MSMNLELVEAQALELNPSDRARLISRLISSLDMDPEVEDAWAAEVERRHAAIESNESSWLPGPTTLSKLKREFS